MNMKPIQINSCIGITILLLLTGMNTLSAQDTMRIDVLKPFIATLGEAIKIQSNPNPEIPEVKTDTFTYETPEIIREDKPTGYTIKPLSMGTSLLPKLKNNYTRIGFGNYNTPLAELYLNTTRNRNFQAGLFAKHLSSSASGDRVFSNNTAGIYGKRFIQKSVLEGDILYHRNVVNEYGYTWIDGKNTGINPAPSGIRNQFSLFGFNTSYANVLKDTSKLGYALRAGYYNYSGSYGLSESNLMVSGSFQKSVQGNPLHVDVALQTNAMTDKSAGKDYNRVFTDINPTYRLISGRTYLQLGFNSTFFYDSNGTKLHFFPKAELGYKLIPNALTAFGGIDGNLKRHTLRSITGENPFVRYFQPLNTIHQFVLFAGIKGMISAQTSFVLEASLSSVKNLQFYAADSAINQQVVLFDKATSGLTTIRAELNHEFGEQFRFGFVFRYMGYDLSIAAPYSLPTITTSLNLMYNMGNKFIIRSEIYTFNERKSLMLPTAVEYTLKGLADINIGLDYHYNRNVKVFLNINNLANNTYQRWLNLPVYGINAIGGLGIVF